MTKVTVENLQELVIFFRMRHFEFSATPLTAKNAMTSICPPKTETFNIKDKYRKCYKRPQVGN